MSSDLMGGIASGLSALMSEYNTISHNIANASTAGFKKQITSFSTKMQDVMDGGNTPLAAGIDATDTFDFSQGQLIQTTRPLDVAMEGTGFLKLETPGGNLYTRNGSMQINILRQLTDSNGNLISGGNGPITIPANTSEHDIQIDPSGRIKVGEFELGQLQVVEFDDMSQLTAVGNCCFTGPKQRRTKVPENTVVRQGYKEDSNVQMMQELTNMLSISRMFEANTSFMTKQSENSKVILGIASS